VGVVDLGGGQGERDGNGEQQHGAVCLLGCEGAQLFRRAVGGLSQVGLGPLPRL
jgi:hypothetical protein